MSVAVHTASAWKSAWLPFSSGNDARNLIKSAQRRGVQSATCKQWHVLAVHLKLDHSRQTLIPGVNTTSDDSVVQLYTYWNKLNKNVPCPVTLLSTNGYPDQFQPLGPVDMLTLCICGLCVHSYYILTEINNSVPSPGESQVWTASAHLPAHMA